MKNHENPEYEGNSFKYHTGKLCIEPNCKLPAGTIWSPYWCQKHNSNRLNNISNSFSKLLDKT